MEIGNIKSTDRGRVILRHPKTGEPLKDAQGQPLAVVLASPEHDAVRRARAEVDRGLRARGDLALLDETAARAAIDDASVAIVAAAVLEWPALTVDGCPLDRDSAEELLALPQMHWLYTQLLAAMGQQRNFIEASALH